MTGRLALRMPPRGSKTDMIPRGTPTPDVRLAFWAKEYGGTKLGYGLTGKVSGALRKHD